MSACPVKVNFVFLWYEFDHKTSGFCHPVATVAFVAWIHSLVPLRLIEPFALFVQACETLTADLGNSDEIDRESEKERGRESVREREWQ